MNDLVANFHFLRPQWLLMLLPLAMLGWYLLRQQAQASNWQSLIAPHLLPFLVDGKSVSRNKLPIYGLIMLWLLATLAAAGPVWKKRPQPVLKQTSALVIAWDLSPSMAAQDIKPSRLVRARLKLIDLLKQRREGLTALIAYSGEAHVVTPLTDDTDTIISLLHGLDPAIMPAIGSNAEMALEMANKLLTEGANGKGNILFLTDGIDESAHDAFAQFHDANPHEITIWGIGTSEGAPIPLSSGGFAYDRNRNMVIARLNEAELSDLAVKVGGLYVPFSKTDFDIETIKKFSFGNNNDTTQHTERLFDQWYEHGPYLIVLLLPFAALAFRRGLLLTLPLLLILAPDSHALEWQDLWKTKDQQAQQLLANDPEKAAETFKSPDWQAVAKYQAGKYDEALEGFNGAKAQDHYNRGNALTHLGNYDEAIEQFQKALELNPDLSDAKQNLSIAEQLKQLQQEQKDQQGDSQRDDENQQQNQNNENNSNQQQSDQQSGQQDSEQQSQQQQSKQQSEQQNQQSQNSQQNQQGQQQDGEQSTSKQNSDSDELTQQQQQALEDAYGKNDEDKQQQDAQKMSQSEQDKDEDAPQNDEQRKQSLVEQQDDAQQQDQEQDPDAPHNPIVRHTLSREEQEQQQALDQWLRKVPDDPSGLMRNKFNYEYRVRKRELRDNGFRQPDGSREQERW
ncbi:Ca-activated chloride channel family protein [Alteromonadaceae bacterium 2753L.S.0a.02]|nr:Ca-activated chloride channel family protein [Alteromonadaceae bacterium 2753L.S.0a.02]